MLDCKTGKMSVNLDLFFAYFCPSHIPISITISTIQIEKSVNDVLGTRTRTADETTELFKT